MTGWMPAALIAMLGEGARRNLEVPSNRVISRKLMAPGFTRDALRGYLGKVGLLVLYFWGGGWLPRVKWQGFRQGVGFYSSPMMQPGLPEHGRAFFRGGGIGVQGFSQGSGLGLRSYQGDGDTRVP